MSALAGCLRASRRDYLLAFPASPAPYVDVPPDSPRWQETPYGWEHLSQAGRPDIEMPYASARYRGNSASETDYPYLLLTFRVTGRPNEGVRLFGISQGVSPVEVYLDNTPYPIARIIGTGGYSYLKVVLLDVFALRAGTHTLRLVRPPAAFGAAVLAGAQVFTYDPTYQP